MRLSVENFGPIEKADIETKRLTIMIGKNNQGKSYIAALIFALLKLGVFLALPGWSVRPHKASVDLVTHIGEHPRFEKPAAKGKDYKLVTITQSDFDKYTDKDLAKRIVDNLVSTLVTITTDHLVSLLEEGFGLNVGELVNINSPSSSIQLDFSKYLSMSMNISKKGKIRVKGQRNEEELDKLTVETVSFVRGIRSQFPLLHVVKGPRAPFPSSMFETALFLSEKMTSGWMKDIFYIPAGRAGLLEGYYSVASALMWLSSRAPVWGISMPPMPPSASEFYGLMLQFRGQKGKMSKISSELAKNVIGGEIIVERDKEQKGMATIKYRFSKDPTHGTLDVIHAGSMVKELTGLYLAIQEKIESGTYIIVEEPESHLHPGAQKKIAGILMKLAAKGVDILITTHSDIILREIAHLVGQRQRTKSKEILPANEVSVILLKEGEKGSFSEELKIPASGILEGIPTFDEVIAELYEEQIRLESQLSKEE